MLCTHTEDYCTHWNYFIYFFTWKIGPITYTCSSETLNSTAKFGNRVCTGTYSLYVKKINTVFYKVWNINNFTIPTIFHTRVDYNFPFSKSVLTNRGYIIHLVEKLAYTSPFKSMKTYLKLKINILLLLM